MTAIITAVLLSPLAVAILGGLCAFGLPRESDDV